MGKELVEMRNGAGEIVSVNAPVVFCAEASVTFAVKLNEPLVVGVPVTWPVIDKLKPFGNEPRLTLQL